MITLTKGEAQQVLDAFVNWDARGRLRIIETLRARLAQPEPKQRTGDCLLTGVCVAEGHHISKAQREWQGLTDEEVLKEFWKIYTEDDVLFTDVERAFYRAIEAKLKEKNR